MRRVIFMCGPAGSGKSTIARRYEQQGMTRLSFDQEAWSRGITTMPLPPHVHRDIEDVLRARLVELVRAGADVVVDFSFWSRTMREEYRELLRPLRRGARDGVPGDRPRDGAPAYRRPGSGGRRRLRDQHGTRGLLLRSLRASHG